MLVIRPQQMAAFSESVFAHFVRSMAERLSDLYPQFAAAWLSTSDSAQKDWYGQVEAMIARARALGFERRDHIQSWLEWQARFGIGFESKPEWAWFDTILQNGLGAEVRMHRIQVRLRRLFPEATQ